MSAECSTYPSDLVLIMIAYVPKTFVISYDDLIVKLHEIEFKAATYKRGLATVEDQLVTYRKREVLFSEEVAVLKREVGCKQYEINMLKTEFEKVKQEKDGIDFKIEKFDKASKDLDQLLGSQITDKSKKGLGYSAVPPPHPLIYNRPNKLDLSYSGLDEFKEPEFKGYGPENSKQESNVVCENESDNSKENSDKSLVKEQVSHDKSSFVEGYGPNTSKSVSEVEPKKVRKNDGAPIIEDWVSDDEEQDESKPKSEKKIVIPTAAKIELVKPENHEKLVKKSVRNMSPKAVLLNTCLTPLNTVRSVNTAHPKTAVHSAKSKIHFSKQAQSTTKRPFYKQTTLTRRSLHEAKRHYYTGRYNAVNIARSYIGQVNDVRGKPQHDDKGFIDSGCSRHMTGNIAYLSDFKQFDGGYVAFGGDTECLVLSPNFKLPDENQILLKIPRKDNMYSFDMKNIIPKESLTCLVAKATLDESMLWHRRLGHINFKNINKLVKDNLILKRFIKEIENLVDKKVKIIRSDNGTEFKNKVMDDFCREKGIKREYSVARTPQQNGVAKKAEMTLLGGCKFDGKSDEGFFVGYSLSSKAFRVYNTRTKRVEENLHIGFLENKPMIEGTGLKWLFDIDSLTQSMNYVPVTAGTISNDSAGTSEENSQDCIVMPIWKDTSYFDSPTKDVDNG
ncbi:putative ribonuclease H-like domain-containing protein [Tanacetum coccineum]